MKRVALGGAIVAALALMLAQAAGASWLEQSTPIPPGAKTWQLNGVSCTTTSVCTAVGDFANSAGTHPLAERRSGETWSVQAVPEPAGASGISLAAVSCASATACTAVGD